jgi:hypothetical protein
LVRQGNNIPRNNEMALALSISDMEQSLFIRAKGDAGDYPSMGVHPGDLPPGVNIPSPPFSQDAGKIPLFQSGHHQIQFGKNGREQGASVMAGASFRQQRGGLGAQLTGK